MKSIGIVLAALMAVGIMFSSVAIAAQTSVDVKVHGNMFVDGKYQSETQDGLPYSGVKYNQNTVALNAWNTSYIHAMDSADGLETSTELEMYFKKGALPASVVVDESVSKSLIASSPGADNSSDTSCYSSEGGFSAMGSYLDLESAAVVSDMDTAYAVNARGMGSMQYVASEYEASGDVNGTWMTSVSEEDVRAHGAYMFEGATVSEAVNFPASGEDEGKDRLCPFSLGWD